jgi:3-ketoacyl-CoA synthase
MRAKRAESSAGLAALDEKPAGAGTNYIPGAHRARAANRARRAAAAPAAARPSSAPPRPPANTDALVPLPLHSADYRHGTPVALKFVKRGYHLLISHALALALVPAAAMGALELAAMWRAGDVARLAALARETDLSANLAAFAAGGALLVAAAAAYFATRRPPVYLLGYALFKGAPDMKVSHAAFMGKTLGCGAFDAGAAEFQRKVLERSGIGEESYVPRSIMGEELDMSMEAARAEAKMVLFAVVADALAATGTRAADVDILIVNCSLFNPTPSLSAMIVNEFKMRSDVASYNLAGMGCSAGLIAIGLAESLLRAAPRGATALVVSTENITLNWYFGPDRSMLISNCLFRAGGVASVLSNRRSDRRRARYELLHVVRTHMGQDDGHYNCVMQKEDSGGRVGIALSKDLMRIAGHALKANITTLGPLVLPASEQLLFLANLAARRGLGLAKRLRPYIPDFKLAFEHFCIHTGGRGVIDAIEAQLLLTPEHVAPSREALHR